VYEAELPGDPGVTKLPGKRAYRSLAAVLSGALLAVSLVAFARPAAAQEQPGAPVEETVANLAAGRVVIAVVKDAILVATVENPIEAQTRPPEPVPIASTRVGVILGAVDWFSPSTQQEIARLDRELPHLRGPVVAELPHLGAVKGGGEASDIEAIGQGLFERLNQVAQGLHAQVDLPPDEPLAELIVVGYLAGYGAEVWQLSYGIKQVQETGDYWTTHAVRPTFLQVWPPEQGQPRTLVEFSYPSDNAPVPLLELMRKKDPRLQKIIPSDPKMAEVAARFLDGTSNKVLAADATQFLRAALDAIAPPNARETMASIKEDTGFSWILPPPPEPKAPEGSQPQQPSDSDRPTLAKPPQ
jgi:hypothetical protein